MYESVGIIGILIVGLAVLIRTYFKNVPKTGKRILLFLMIYGIGMGIFQIATFMFPILFHLWATGVIFILIMLVIAGIRR